VVALLEGCSFELAPGDPRNGDTAPDGGAAADGSPADGSTDSASDSVLVLPCPSSYAGGYRLVTTPMTWLASEESCEADLPGQTHLVVIETEAERVAVAELAQALAGDAWVGIVRDPGGQAPWPWHYVTGGDATFAPFEGSEPNNMSGDQFTVVIRKSSRFLYDYGVGNLVPAICECDNRPPIDADYDPGT